MKRALTFSIILMTALQACQQDNIPIEASIESGQNQLIVHANNINWQPCPPNLPDGCEMAVLEGNPKNAELYTVRFRTSQAFTVPLHTHPKNERATILAGHVHVAFGKGKTKEDAEVFGPGDYYVNAPNKAHTVWVDSATVLQITGIGPWEVHPVE